MRAMLVPGLLFAMALAGCAGGSGDDGYVTPPTDDQGRYLIQLTGGNKVVPAMAKVPLGATVVWKVGAGGIHDVTTDSGAPESFSSDSQYPSKMREGQEFTRTMAKAGDYPYKCVVHGAMMQATLRVK